MANVGAMKLVGAAELKQLLTDYPEKVAAAAARTGMRKSAKLLQGYFIASAPEKTGKLRRAIRVAKVRGKDKFSPRFKVGLGRMRGENKIRFYYKTLEFDTKRGDAMNPFMLSTWNAHREEIAQLIIDETRNAVYSEAARIHRRTLGLKKKEMIRG